MESKRIFHVRSMARTKIQVCKYFKMDIIVIVAAGMEIFLNLCRKWNTVLSKKHFFHLAEHTKIIKLIFSRSKDLKRQNLNRKNALKPKQDKKSKNVNFLP